MKPRILTGMLVRPYTETHPLCLVMQVNGDKLTAYELHPTSPDACSTGFRTSTIRSISIDLVIAAYAAKPQWYVEGSTDPGIFEPWTIYKMSSNPELLNLHCVYKEQS